MKGNMGTIDRILRTIIAVVLGILYFTKILSGTVGVILLVIAIIFLLTSLVGYCPLYSIIGVSTKRKA
jgi:uncharacterized membrane protein